jgi:hypothetical protein
MDPWRLENEVTEYYRFTAGFSSWSQFQGLKDAAGAFVKFDQPLELSYTHTTANDFDGDSSNDGKTFRLSYNGPGQLQVPWKYNKDIGREMPQIAIKGGATVGTYTIWPVDGEQRLVKTDDANCSGLSLADVSKLPTNDKKVVSISWSEATDTPIRYIGGVSTAE